MAAAQIPKTQKAAIYDNPGTISTRVVEVGVPEPGEGEVLVRLSHSGICHSDLSVMMKSWKTLPYPTQAGQIGGHEGVGEVVKFGPGTSEAYGLSIGSRVGIKWIANICGQCAPCREGVDNLCFKQTISGYYSPGTFQQYVTSPAHYVTPIPDGVPSDEAAPLLCAGLTVYAALKRTKAQPGEWVVISGAGGGLGHLAVQIASRGMGLRVIGIDHGSKEEIARISGAEHFIDVTEYGSDDEHKAIAAAVKSLTTDGLGVHGVVVCVASNVAYAQALLFLRFNGTMVCVGVPEHEPRAIATAFPALLMGAHLNATGSSVGTQRDAIQTLEFASRGIIKASFRTIKLEGLRKVFEEMQAGKLQGRVVIDLS
ncbi:alcohol dehydrogenase II [Aspergillus pseudodeflectus]|uniref:Alcohol dehydrogenase II n=1 Tax=Aspergillus pseudodeflectus TaxID=176178 RepID=A0ABR4JBD5_9EURO